MEQISESKCHGGRHLRFRHLSRALSSDTVFSVYLPPLALKKPVPALYWLSGLTCTDENFSQKSGAQRYAAEHGIALVIPDTSPRGKDVPDVPERADLGQGAGFYVNATQPPWSTHYRMYEFINDELPALIESELPLVAGLKSISGHSMGGHGALISCLKNPGMYRSVSAFAPISNPVRAPWGEACFSAYLGDDRARWREYDAVELIRAGAESLPLLVDQGTADGFLDAQLQPRRLEQACIERGIPLDLRMREGYDHGYYFIASFIGEHIAYHAEKLFF